MNTCITDIPTLRTEYRALQVAGLKLMGRHALPKDFTALVQQEIDYQGVEATPQNWVNVADEVLERMAIDMGREPIRLAEVG